MNSCYEQFGPPPGGFPNTWGKDVVDAADAACAAGVVRGAAWDAASAAWGAAWYGWDAASVAWDAASVASAAREVAAEAGDAEIRRQRESLLRLIREAPVVTPSTGGTAR
jgi:hypothetical protein